jgi:hypothetical protein
MVPTAWSCCDEEVVEVEAAVPPTRNDLPTLRPCQQSRENEETRDESGVMRTL